MEVSNSRDDVQAETSTGLGRKVEIKIKTLDSQVYTCSVDENISVPALKEHVATLTGVPVENQRLICRGKVLKDDHSLSVYNVEDGHTLHLVTRQVPPGGPSSSPGTGSARDVQGGEDGSQGGPRRPAQISHSVVMGTFNVPDGGDGGLPDVNRIISSVLTSLGLANLTPAMGGTSTTGVTNSPAPGTGPDSISGGVTPSPSDASNSVTNPGISAAQFSPVMIPAMGQQFRFLQQVIPDALTTITQYMDSLDQMLTNGGQHESTVPSLGIEISQSNASSTATRSRPTPANLGALIRRTMELINGQARDELRRLSSQLEDEENMTDATARGDVQTSALRNGVLLQHLGALFLELGRATLTLRMGTSHNEAAVNAGPAVFISPTGPNPMMVQPIPFQPTFGFGTSNPAPQTPSASGEIPRNISIHIHANDNTPLTGNPIQSVVLGQGAGVNNPTIRVPLGGTAGPAPAPSVHTIAVPISANSQPTSGEQQPGVRVVPVRAVVAALPSNLQGRSPGEIATAPSGLLHPLLARFQQLNSQQPNGSPAAVHGISPTPGVVTPSSGIPQQAVNAVQPTIRAQVQVQAWVPDGQGGSRLLSNEEALRTLFTSPQNGTQNPLQGQPLSAAPSPAEVPPSSATQTPSQGQPDSNSREEPESSSGERNNTETGQSETSVAEKGLGFAKESPENNGRGEEVQKEDQGKYSQSREASSSEASVAKAQHKDGNTSNAPAGLGFGGLQPLPSRIPKRPPRNNQNSQFTSSSTQPSQETQLRLPTQLATPDSGASRPINNVPLFSDSGNNIGIGNMVSQLLGGGSSGGGSRDLEQNLGLPGGALGNMMGQMMQNPFMRNVVQQVVEQVGEGDHEDALSQGNLDFSGLLQQMMPIVGQALTRATPASGQDQVSSLLQGIGSRGSARPNLERLREGPTASNSPNLSSLLQQMMPVVAQALGGQHGNRSETSTGITPNLNSAPNVNGINEVDLQQEEHISNAPCQIEASQQESSSIERSEVAPIPKRQKINVEKAVEKVEQGSPPDEILRVVAETASMILEPNINNESNISSLAEYLCQDDALVDDYMALLLKDISLQGQLDL